MEENEKQAYIKDLEERNETLKKQLREAVATVEDLQKQLRQAKQK